VVLKARDKFYTCRQLKSSAKCCSADQKFDDIRISKDKWPEIKPTTPTGVLPFVETPDGKFLTQSAAIARYLAKKFNLYGKTECDFYKIERALEQIHDIVTELYKILFTPSDKQEAAKKEFNEGKGKALVKDLAKFLTEEKTGFFAGSTPTIADFALVHVIGYLQIASQELLKENPEIEAHYTKTVEATPTVKKWIAERPVTQF